MDRDAIDRLLDTIDRQLEDVHWPTEYWQEVDEIADCMNPHSGFSEGHTPDNTVYARRMVESRYLDGDLCFTDELGNCECSINPSSHEFFCWSCNTSLRSKDADTYDGLCPFCAADTLPRMAGAQTPTEFVSWIMESA